MRTVSLAALLGTASAYNLSKQPKKVHCKMTANDKVTEVMYGKGTSWTRVKATRHAGNADEKWKSTTYSFVDEPEKELRIKVQDKTWNGNKKKKDDKSGAFSMKCTAPDGSAWNGFKSNVDECWDAWNADQPLCTTNKQLSFDGYEKRVNVEKEYKIWHCNSKEARTVMKCKPNTPPPTADPTASPTTSPTASPTTSPTASPTNLQHDRNHVELGSFASIGHAHRSIGFSTNFKENPVFFANAITNKNTDAVTTKISGAVTSSGVDGVHIQEPSCNGNRDTTVTEPETLDWMALMEGTYGEVVVGSATKTDGVGFMHVDFENQFSTDDIVVLVAIQQDTDADEWKIVRVTSSNKSGFDFWVQQQEGANALTSDQQTVVVGWMAMPEGKHNLLGYSLHARKVSSEQGDKILSVPLNNYVGAETPLIFGNIASGNGGDPAFIRIVKEHSSLNVGQYMVLVDEETCKNAETAHVSEDIFLVTINPQQEFHVEVGEFNDMTQNAEGMLVRHAAFKESFQRPPVFFSNAITANGVDAVTTKIGKISKAGATSVRLIEPTCGHYGAGDHPMAEELDWMALPVGEFGGIGGGDYSGIKVGRVSKGLNNNANNANAYGEAQVNFENPFQTDDVVVLVNIQEDISNHWKIARAYNINKNGFTVRVQREQGGATGNGNTVVGWLAMEVGQHTLDGYIFKAEKTVSSSGTHIQKTLWNSHGQEVPYIFGSIGNRGGDPAFLRIRKAANEQHFNKFEVFIDEELCLDGEQWHIAEDINVITVNPTQGTGRHTVLSEASHQFWDGTSLDPSMFPEDCIPDHCPTWSCARWCQCFEFPGVAEIFESSEYKNKLLALCPDDDDETCDCSLQINNGNRGDYFMTHNH